MFLKSSFPSHFCDRISLPKISSKISFPSFAFVFSKCIHPCLYKIYFAFLGTKHLICLLEVEYHYLVSILPKKLYLWSSRHYFGGCIDKYIFFQSDFLPNFLDFIFLLRKKQMRKWCLY